jgi:predicted neuraminidase
VSLLSWEAVAEPSERYPACHCSVITQLDNGDVLVGFYAGSGEARPDAAWVLARRRPDEEAFGELSVVADTDGKPEGNGILYQNSDGTLICIYGVMHGKLNGEAGEGVRWRTCDLRMKTSGDRGSNWSDVQMIDPEWGNVPRCNPIRLNDGSVLFGVEYDDGNSRMWRSEDDARSWTMCGRVEGSKNQHPALLERTDGSILALLRPCGGQGRILQSVSVDGGRQWTPAELSELHSPFAGLDAVRLQDGRFVVVYNSNPEARNPLSIAVSEDEGRSWPTVRDLVSGSGQFHYPAIIQDRDGRLQVTFTNNRKTIDHVVLELDWLDGAGKGLLWEDDQRKRAG